MWLKSEMEICRFPSRLIDLKASSNIFNIFHIRFCQTLSKTIHMTTGEVAEGTNTLPHQKTQILQEVVEAQVAPMGEKREREEEEEEEQREEKVNPQIAIYLEHVIAIIRAAKSHTGTSSRAISKAMTEKVVSFDDSSLKEALREGVESERLTKVCRFFFICR
jgi:hypothetical protein